MTKAKSERPKDRKWDQLKKLGDQFSAAARAGRAACAAELARRFLRKDPGCPWVLARYADVLTDLGRFREARQAAREAVRLLKTAKETPWTSRGLWLAYSWMGHVYKSMGRHSQAAKSYEKAIEQEPRDAGPHIFLGIMLAGQGKFDQAKPYLRKALACTEGCRDEAYLNLGLIARAERRYKRAARYLSQAIELDPKYTEAKKVLRDVEKAQAILAKPVARSSRRVWKRALSAHGHWRLACAHELIRQYVRKESDNGWGFTQWGRVLTDLGRYGEARAAIRKGTTLIREAHWSRPKHLSLCYSVTADLYWEMRRYKQAATWYRKALDQHPCDLEYRNLGDVSARQGDLVEAERLYRRAARFKEGREESYACLAWVLRSQQRYAEAAKYLRKALDIDPNYKCTWAPKMLKDVEGAIAIAAES